MPFAFKLSRRLARIRDAVVFGLTAMTLVQCLPVAPFDSGILMPDVVSDLIVTSTEDSLATLSFTEVNDGGGRPANYEVRYAKSPFSGASSTTVTSGTCAGTLRGTVIGAKRTCTVTGLQESTDYSFQLTAFRDTSTSSITSSSQSNVASGSTKKKVGSVTVDPSSLNGAVGQTAQLTATVWDTYGNILAGRSVNWSSSNQTVAMVSVDGMLSALAVGTAVVTASAGGKTGEAQVAVSLLSPGSPGAVADLAASSANDSSAALVFTEVDDGTGQPANYEVRFAVSPLSWGSAARVTRGTCAVPVMGAAIGARRTCTVLGLAAASSYGFQLLAFRATLNTTTAVFGPLSNIASATTTAAPVAAVATVIVSPATLSGTVGQTAQLTATLRDSAGNLLTGRTISWSSTNTAVATVSSVGLVSEVGAGTTNITATSEGKSGQSQASVTAPAPAPVATVTVSPVTSSVLIGATVQLTATTRDSSGATLTGRAITWTTGNALVASVSGSGLVTGVGVGTIAITATSEGKSGTAQVTVSAPSPPPPAGPDEPVDPSGGYLWNEDYDRYTSVISMLSSGICASGTDGYGVPAASTTYGNRRTEPNFTDGCNLQKNADGNYIYNLIAGRTGSGKAIRGMIAVGNQGVNWNGPWNAADIDNSVAKTVVMQHWFRASVGGGPGPIGMKWIEVWVNDAGSQVRSSAGQKVIRLQWSTNGGGNSHWRANDGPNTSGFPRTLQPIGPYLDHGIGKLNDGNWHRVTYLFRGNTTATYYHTGGTSPADETYTGTSSRDGRMAMWVDGNKVLDYSQATVGITPVGGTGPWCYQSDVDWIPTGTYFQRIQYPGTNNDTQTSWIWDSDDLKIWQF